MTIPSMSPPNMGRLVTSPREDIWPGMRSSKSCPAILTASTGTTWLDPNVTVHSLRVTALTTARARGSDIIDLQDFAGHGDPTTTFTYIRSRDRLSKSPAYVLTYCCLKMFS